MVYGFSHYWFWLFAIFVIGVTNGLLTKQAEKHRPISPWLIWFGLAFGVGLILVPLDALAGRAGLWLETGLASFASFIAGAAAGVFARRGSLREHRDWALGLVPCLLLWCAGNLFSAPRIEADLSRSVEAAVKSADGDPKNFLVDGRDVLLPNSVANRAALVSEINKVDGVRQVTGTDWVFSEGARTAPVAENGSAESGEQGAAGQRPNRIETTPGPSGRPARTEAERARRAPSRRQDTADKTGDAGAGVADAGRPAVDKAKAARTLLAALPPTGPLDIATCQSALDAEEALQEIAFRGRGVAIHRAAANVLDRIAALLLRCPAAKVRIAVRADRTRDEEEDRILSQRRAERIAQYLIVEGVPSERLAVAGDGSKNLAAPQEMAGAAQSRRVEFILR